MSKVGPDPGTEGEAALFQEGIVNHNSRYIIDPDSRWVKYWCDLDVPNLEKWASNWRRSGLRFGGPKDDLGLRKKNYPESLA